MIWKYQVRRVLTPLWNWGQWVFSGARLLMIGGTLVLLLSIGRIFGRSGSLPSQSPGLPGSDELTRERIRVGERHLEVEVAQTPAAIEQGLSDRAELGADGMLFVFERPMQTSFWMLRMQFALDMIWLDQDSIVQIDANVPPPSQTDGVPVVVQPRSPVTAVLEVPAGTASAAGWTVGTPWYRGP